MKPINPKFGIAQQQQAGPVEKDNGLVGRAMAVQRTVMGDLRTVGKDVLGLSTQEDKDRIQNKGPWIALTAAVGAFLVFRKIKLLQQIVKSGPVKNILQRLKKT